MYYSIPCVEFSDEKIYNNVQTLSGERKKGEIQYDEN